MLTASAVRERAGDMLAVGIEGKLDHFRIETGQLEPTARFVADVVQSNYPNLKVPLHARWRHFVFGGRDLWSDIAARQAWRNAAQRARAEIDLTVVSVLLDAGVHPRWRYSDRDTGISVGRSEGLALASLRMFETGFFSSRPDERLRVDATKLQTITVADLKEGFGVGDGNPFPDLDGRAALLARLGRAIAANSATFATDDSARPGGLFDHLRTLAREKPLGSADILHQVLLHFGPVWPDRLAMGGLSLGDTWRHPAIRRADMTNGLMPLHKLSQWLTYSLLEPCARAGIHVHDADALTGLAEYRNGGLFIDAGVLALRDPAMLTRPHEVGSSVVVEWRALTVALLDRLAPLIRRQLGVSEGAFPLGSVLEGGTWAAGRRLASDRRTDGSPPLKIISDGTVF